jgi:hypothetical protein
MLAIVEQQSRRPLPGISGTNVYHDLWHNRAPAFGCGVRYAASHYDNNRC